MEHLDVVALIKAVQILERNVTVALMYSGLRIPQFRLLDVLAAAGQATVTELSETLRITRATASVLVNDLIRDGVVAVVEHPGDRRSFHVRLTEHGMAKLHVARSDLGVLKNELSKNYPAEIIRTLNAFTRTTTAR